VVLENSKFPLLLTVSKSFLQEVKIVAIKMNKKSIFCIFLNYSALKIVKKILTLVFVF